MNSVHEGKRPYKCPQCDLFFAHKSGLQFHVNSIHEKKEIYKCLLCSYTSLQKGAFAAHIESLHEKRSYDCLICGVIFKQKTGLNQHIKIQHENKKGLSDLDKLVKENSLKMIKLSIKSKNQSDCIPKTIKTNESEIPKNNAFDLPLKFEFEI